MENIELIGLYASSSSKVIIPNYRNYRNYIPSKPLEQKQNFLVQINNRENTMQMRIIHLWTCPNQNYINVQLYSSNKVLMINDFKFLEWLLCDELNTFLNMANEELYHSFTVEYGYYQGSEQSLGLFKHFNEYNFPEEMFHIILGYAKYMTKNHTNDQLIVPNVPRRNITI